VGCPGYVHLVSWAVDSRSPRPPPRPDGLGGSRDDGGLERRNDETNPFVGSGEPEYDETNPFAATRKPENDETNPFPRSAETWVARPRMCEPRRGKASERLHIWGGMSWVCSPCTVGPWSRDRRVPCLGPTALAVLAMTGDWDGDMTKRTHFGWVPHPPTADGFPAKQNRRNEPISRPVNEVSILGHPTPEPSPFHGFGSWDGPPRNRQIERAVWRPRKQRNKPIYRCRNNRSGSIWAKSVVGSRPASTMIVPRDTTLTEQTHLIGGWSVRGRTVPTFDPKTMVVKHKNNGTNPFQTRRNRANIPGKKPARYV